MAAVAAFILAPEIGIPTMPLQFKVSHQNNHSLPKIPRNSHVCVSQQEGTCLAHLCSSEQRMYFPTTHIPIFVDHASPYQFWQRQAVAPKNKYGVLEDYYCLKTRLGLVGGLAIAFFPLSILLILCQPLATTDLMLQQPKKNDKSLTPTITQKIKVHGCNFKSMAVLLALDCISEKTSNAHKTTFVFIKCTLLQPCVKCQKHRI